MTHYRNVLMVISFFYFLLFFVIPYFFILERGGDFIYAGNYFSFDFGELYYVGFSAFLFFLVYAFSVRILFGTRGVIHEVLFSKKMARRVFAICLIYSLIYALYYIFFFDVEQAYNVRRGLSNGDHLSYFGLIVFNVLGVYLILESDNHSLKKTTLLLAFCLFFISLLTSSGRANTILFLVMFCFSFFRIGIGVRNLTIGFLFFLVALPFVINMKHFIYNIGVNGQFYNIINYYSSDFDVYGFLSNFAHPVVSALVAENIVDNMGYRFFYDYIQGFIFYFKIFGLDTGDSITYFNTYAIIGERSSVIPPGHIAFGLLQMGYLGVLISAFFWAFIGYVCSLFGNRFFSNSKLSAFYFPFIAANSFYHGDVRIIILTVLLVLILFFVFKKVLFIRLS